MNQNKKCQSNNHNIYQRKKSIRQLQIKQCKNTQYCSHNNKDKTSQKKANLKAKTKEKTSKIEHLKTHEPQIQQALPYVRRPNPKRNFNHLANLTSNLRGISKLEFNDTDYLTQKYQNQNHQSKCLDFIKKQFQQNQKTMPIDQSNNTTAQTKNLIKQIIAKSRSRALLNNPFHEASKNEQSVNHSISLNRKYSQSQNRCQRSQQRILQKKPEILNFLQKQSHKNIRSCKQIQLFRISSKKNLVLDRQNQQTKIRSIRSIQRDQKCSNEGKLQPSKSSRYGYGILGQKQQNILKTLLQTKKSSQLQIKQNISHNTNTLASLNTLQFDQKNISQIKQVETSDKDSEQNQLLIPSIDCSIICENQQQFSESSFFNSTAKHIIGNIDHQKNVQSNFETIGDRNFAIIKKANDQKNRKKILQVDKLRKKFPTDFFKN